MIPGAACAKWHLKPDSNRCRRSIALSDGSLASRRLNIAPTFLHTGAKLGCRPLFHGICRGNHLVRRTTVPGMAACETSGQHRATFVRSEFVNVFDHAHFGEPRRLTSTAAPTQTNIVCRMKAGHATA